MAKIKKKSSKQTYFDTQRKTKRKAEAKKKNKRKRIKKVIVTTVCTVLAVGIVGGGVTWISIWAAKTHPLMHRISVMKTKNASVNAAEMSFYAWQIYQQYMEQNSEAASVPDPEKPLSDQSYSSDMTWEEYFIDCARDYANNLLVLCDAAYREDFTPEDNITGVAKSMMTDLDLKTLPKGVTEEDAQHALELYILAWEYSEHLTDTMTYSEEELTAYYESDPLSMQICDYMYFSFAYGDDETSIMDMTQAEEYARELRRCTTREKFEKWVYDYYKENTTLTEDELQQQIGTLASESASYSAGDPIREWAFSGESKAGETTILTDEDNCQITVCLMLSEPRRNDTYAINVRQILLTADTYGSAEDAYAAAQDIMKSYENTNQTEDDFAALADQYTEDTSASGGLYTDVTESDLLSDWKDWYFDPKRQYGDVTVLYSIYGSAVVYYINTNEKPVWESTAELALQESIYDEQYSAIEKTANVETLDLGLKLIQVD